MSHKTVNQRGVVVFDEDSFAVNAVVERIQTSNVPEFVIHLNVPLAPPWAATNKTQYNPSDVMDELTPIGYLIINRLLLLPGLGDVTCTSYSFAFTVSKVFDPYDAVLHALHIVHETIYEIAYIHEIAYEVQTRIGLSRDEMTCVTMRATDEIHEDIRELTK